jgi:hypothetical protein
MFLGCLLAALIAIVNVTNNVKRCFNCCKAYVFVFNRPYALGMGFYFLYRGKAWVY